MKLETERQRHTFINVIDELRKETHHENTYITREEIDALKWIWVHSKNRQRAKECMKVNLDWSDNYDD